MNFDASEKCYCVKKKLIAFLPEIRAVHNALFGCLIVSRKLRPIFEICSTYFKYGISSTIRNICSKKLGPIFEMNFDAIKES